MQETGSTSSSDAGSELPLPDALQEQLGALSPEQQEARESGSETGSSGSGSGSGSDSEAEHRDQGAPDRPVLDKDQRKAHKKAVKEANRERRKTKVPKKVKKKMTNKGKR